jgi:hypothetical protein
MSSEGTFEGSTMLKFPHKIYEETTFNSMFYIPHLAISVVFDDPKYILSGANLESSNSPKSSQTP